HHPHPLSVPTRRSSDLKRPFDKNYRFNDPCWFWTARAHCISSKSGKDDAFKGDCQQYFGKSSGSIIDYFISGRATGRGNRYRARSEEHTSELQSRFDLV